MKKYEIKEPDLDFIERSHPSLEEASMEPERYTLKKKYWTKKNKTRKLFEKKPVTILFTGDITCFDKQFEAAKTESGYDFTYEFDLMRPIFAQADLVVGNMETVLCSYAPYRSEKVVIEENFYCNAPLDFLDAVKKSGIDVLTNSNNHDIDAGAIGLGETIDNLENFGFIHTGTFKDDRKRYELIDVEGYKVAITAFATDHNALSCNITEEGQKAMLSDYSKEAAQTIISGARADGAETVIACIHWGKENKTEVHQDQYRIGQELADMGYDCIIGSHPHVLQKYSTIKSGSRDVPVFYSLGNYVSQNINNIKARSAVACVKLNKTRSGIDISCSYIPVITSESYKGKGFVVMPVKADTANSRNAKKLQRIKNELGEEISPCLSFTYEDYTEDKVKHEKKGKAPEPDLSQITEWPFDYADSHFSYKVFEDHVRLTGILPEYRSVSCTVPEAVLGLPVTDADEGVFRNNDHLKKIKCVSVPYISKGFCKDCTYLEGFRMGLDAYEVQEEAFAGCISLYSAIMKRGIKTIGSRAFKGCTNLKSVKIPSNVTSIADDAFEGCNRAVFYCEKDSYAEKYAHEHGFTVKNMDM